MKPAMHDKSVVLPQPDAPSATTKSPGSRPRLTSESARVVRPDVPAYLTLTLRSSSLLKGHHRRRDPLDYPAFEVKENASFQTNRKGARRPTGDRCSNAIR